MMKFPTFDQKKTAFRRAKILLEKSMVSQKVKHERGYKEKIYLFVFFFRDKREWILFRVLRYKTHFF